jgi:hypothetical protein
MIGAQETHMYEPVFGLEIHTQILTKTKHFYSCSTQYGNLLNTLTCPSLSDYFKKAILATKKSKHKSNLLL